MAPMFGLAFLLAFIFAPSRSYRFAFSGALLIEAASFVGVLVIWARGFGGI
jgi:hypothetical protein